MNIISRPPHRPGTKRNPSNTTRSSLVLVLAIHVVSFLLLCSSQSPITGTATAFQLTPSTPPGEIIEQQLAALRDGDIEAVYKFASPGNKKQTGDVTTFAKMVQSGPYRYVHATSSGSGSSSSSSSIRCYNNYGLVQQETIATHRVVFPFVEMNIIYQY
jgi:hypothetical protein